MNSSYKMGCGRASIENELDLKVISAACLVYCVALTTLPTHILYIIKQNVCVRACVSVC